ncbi:MAG: putative extracellular nuclease [Parvicella sp.]|jgi:predicted extracellular nuclease
MKSAAGHPIVFYNVENLFDIHDDKGVMDSDFTPSGKKKWTQERYERKLKSLENILLNIDSKHPIIVGLTEVENRGTIEDLIGQDSISKINYEIIHQNSPDNRGIDVGLYYDADRVEYLQHQYLRIDFPWNLDIKTRDVLFFQANLNGEPFWFVVNHWPSRRNGALETEEKRLHTAQMVRKKLDQIQLDYPNDKIVIMGDFNDEPINRSITHILKAKRDKKIRVDEFFNLAAEQDENHQGTSTHMWEWLMLDQIMVSRNLLHADKSTLSLLSDSMTIFEKGDVLFCRVNGKCQPNATFKGSHYTGGVSDHLPVYIVLDQEI